MSVSIEPLRDRFAGEVSGVDCTRPLSPTEVSAVNAGMDAYGVLVFHDQAFTDAEQLAFTLNFGAIEKGGYGMTRIHFRTEQENRTLGSGIGDFSNVGGDGKPIARDGRAYAFKLADRLWHSDSSFKAVPAKWSLLSGRSVASWGGNTEFADMRAAYDGLDDRWRREIEDLVCLHSQIYSREKVGFTDLNDAERQAFKPVRQRLVRVHPATGRKSLFLSSHAGAVEGMSIADGRMLLHELTEFATQERFVYSHKWRVNDFVVWDNGVTMHRGRRFDPAEARDVRQTRLAGDAMTIEQAA